jgi:nucleoside-diphosphate-sugar epimerase
MTFQSVSDREKKRSNAAPTTLLRVIVGADGFVGRGLAETLQTERVVYGPAHDGEIHITQAEGLIKNADVIINAGGFRVRPGCTYADYRRSHQEATATLVPWVRKDALFLHMSSGSVLGKSTKHKLGRQTPPNPRSFPSPAYALAKLEADQFLQEAAAKRGFRVIFLRPAVVYSPQGAGMVGTVLKLAKRGIILRLYPRDARHHFCHMNLLTDVVGRIIEKNHRLPHLSSFVVADPYTVSNRDLEAMLRQHLSWKTRTVPVPVQLVSAFLRHMFHSRNPKLDLRTWGEIFGVLNLNSTYDPSETFQVLGIDPAHYSLECTLLPLIQQVLRQ